MVVQMEMFHEHGDWGVNGGSQEKEPRLLLKLGDRGKKKERVGGVRCGA